jgi:hypothetical protein
MKFRLVLSRPDAKTRQRSTIHVVLQTQDDGETSLFAYRRAILASHESGPLTAAASAAFSTLSKKSPPN